MVQAVFVGLVGATAGVNLGGGGGGVRNFGSAGSGGSGVVIIAYPGAVARATGGNIDTSSRSGYVVHTFTSSGTFTV